MSRTYGSLALAAQEPLAFDENWVKEQESRNYCKDNATKSFTDLSEMLAFIGKREENSSWLIGTNTNALGLMLLEDATLVQLSAIQEVILDTKENTNLCLRGGELRQTALRSCAIPSLQNRAKIFGAALGKVSTLVLRNILNDCLKVAHKNATTKIRLAEEKVSAVLSSEYVPLSMPTIFETAAGYIGQKFPSNYFAGGSWSHSITTAEWELTGEHCLIKTYKEALAKHGVEHDEIQPGLRLSTSDIGVSGVNLMPKLVAGKDRLLLPLGGPVGLEHKGDASMGRFQENLEGVFSLYGERLERLTLLLDVEIANPVNCMNEVLKRLGVPKKYGTPTVEVFQRGFSDEDSCTAHDIFYGLGELLLQLQIHKATGEQVLRMEETIAKALSLNFAEYDIPGEDQ